jgi:hypothetical protein
MDETALNPRDPAGDYAAKRKALQDLGMNKAVDQAAVLQRRLDLDREAKARGIAEDTGSWIVYDPETKQIRKRFKTHTAGKSYAKAHGLGFASSEFYFDRVKDNKEVAENDDWDDGEWTDDAEHHAVVKAQQPIRYPESVLRAIERNPAMRADIIRDYKRKQQQGVAEGGYSNYDNNRTGFGRRGREDDEYHVPDPVETKYNIKVNGQVINQQPFANRAAALAWAKKAVSAGKLDPKNAKLSPINQVTELSNEKLGQYKQAAALDAGAADKRGNFERGDKRFAGIVKATKKQFANDVKNHKPVSETPTDYSKRRQRERDVDAGRPVKSLPKNPQTDYARKRAKEKRDLEQFGEEFEMPGTTIPQKSIIRGYVVYYNPQTQMVSITRRGDSEEAAIEQARLKTPSMLGFETTVSKLINRIEQDLVEDGSTSSDAVERAILNRIMVAHTDLLMQFGPDKVMQAAEEVAYNVGDVDEIGTSDVSAYVNQVKQILGVA